MGPGASAREAPGVLEERGEALDFGCVVEGDAAVGEGVNPVLIEQAGQQAGYPAAPLQLMDELTLTLPQKIRKETEAALKAEGKLIPEHGSNAVVDWMVENGRTAKKDGKGFYDYDENRNAKPSPEVEKVIRTHLTGRQFGVLGEQRVNVLAVNLSLDGQ